MPTTARDTQRKREREEQAQKNVRELLKDEYDEKVASGEISDDPLEGLPEPVPVGMRRVHRKKVDGKVQIVEKVNEPATTAPFEFDEEERGHIRGLFMDGVFGKRKIVYLETDDPLTDMPTIAFRLLINNRGVHTMRSIGVLLGVRGETVGEWSRKHPRFSLALEMGKALQEYVLASRLARGMTYGTTLMFTMKNLHGWAEKLETSQRISIAAVIANAEEKAVYVDWEKPDVSLLASKVSSGQPASQSPERIGQLTDSTPQGKPEGQPMSTPSGVPIDATVWSDDGIPAGVPVAGENSSGSDVVNK